MALIDDDIMAEVPEGYPTKDSPVVQAVARELLGGGDDYWHSTIISNRATALHAAVRAVHAVLQLDQPATADLWELAADGEHVHRYQGQTLRHGHPGGEVEHGYYEHDEDRPVTTEDVNIAMEPRQPTVAELVEEFVWQTRRLLDAQWDVANIAARIRSQQ